MRLSPVLQVPDGAALGRDVRAFRPSSSIRLLRQGTRMNAALRDGLVRSGIRAVWIDDPVADGIDPPDLLDGPRAMALEALRPVLAGAARGRGPTPAQGASLVRAADAIVHGVREAAGRPVANLHLRASDDPVADRCVNAAVLGVLMAEAAEGDEDGAEGAGRSAERLALGLLVHDVGWATLPGMPRGTGRPGPGLLARIRAHPEQGLSLLAGLDLPPLARAAVSAHHERWDGAGYPLGLEGREIHPVARLAAVAVAHETIAAFQASHERRPGHVALDVVRSLAGTAFDPVAVALLEQVVLPYPPGTRVMLTDGRRGVVVAVPRGAPLSPQVRVTHVRGGAPCLPAEVDLSDTPRVTVAEAVADPAARFPSPLDWDPLDPLPRPVCLEAAGVPFHVVHAPPREAAAAGPG